MKSLKNKLFITFFCIFLIIQIFSNVDIYGQLPGIYMPSPQTWDFMKYGNVPVGLYTGRLDLQIPIYHYQDSDFDINITLGYNSAGFIPSKPSGPVGLNWFLNCGGVISRRVMDIPDDVTGEPGTLNSTFFRYHGILKYSKDSRPVIPNANIDKLSTGQEHYTGDWVLYYSSADKYETTPDIFSFNFGKHRGSFMIDCNGKIHVFDCDNSGTYKIDLSGMNLQTNDPAYKNSTIKITTSDGYIYEFGGEKKYVEYLFIYFRNNYDLSANNKMITSWYLKSITAPNNRKVEFDYKDVNNDEDKLWLKKNFPPDDGNYIVTAIPHTSKMLYHQSNSAGIFSFHEYTGGAVDYESKLGALKTAFLTKISIDGICTIDFVYSKKDKLDIHDYPNYAKKTFKLENINITDLLENKNVDQITFSYNYYGQTNKERLFLVGINNNGSL